MRLPGMLDIFKSISVQCASTERISNLQIPVIIIIPTRELDVKFNALLEHTNLIAFH